MPTLFFLAMHPPANVSEGNAILSNLPAVDVSHGADTLRYFFHKSTMLSYRTTEWKSEKLSCLQCAMCSCSGMSGGFLFAWKSNHCQVSFTSRFVQFLQNSVLIMCLSSAYVHFLVADTINTLLPFIKYLMTGSWNSLLTLLMCDYFCVILQLCVHLSSCLRQSVNKSVSKSVIYLLSTYSFNWLNLIISIQVKWVPRHHGMARPQVADGGDGLQIWRLAANILNKQSRTADSGRSSSFWVERRANNPPP
jgi:hypothetical protein